MGVENIISTTVKAWLNQYSVEISVKIVSIFKILVLTPISWFHNIPGLLCEINLNYSRGIYSDYYKIMEKQFGRVISYYKKIMILLALAQHTSIPMTKAIWLLKHQEAIKVCFMTYVITMPKHRQSKETL